MASVRTFQLGVLMLDVPDYPAQAFTGGTDNLRTRQVSRLWYRKSDAGSVAEFEPAQEQYQRRITGLLAPGALEESPAVDSLESLFIEPSAS
jgi:hypothetical protein